MTEREWKVFRQLQPAALDRFCRRVLAEVAGLAADESRTPHDRYLAAFGRMKERDRELAAAFDSPSRSSARVQLAHLRRLGLVTDAEFAGFAPDTRAAVEAMAGR